MDDSGLLDGTSANDTIPVTDTAPEYPYPIGEQTAIWEPCSLHEGEDDGRAECATLELPLFWNDQDDGRTLGIRAKRLRAKGESEAQLWLLAGGPGQSGTWTKQGVAK